MSLKNIVKESITFIFSALFTKSTLLVIFSETVSSLVPKPVLYSVVGSSWLDIYSQ